jgi:predicted negative regulator of RcsB-dependent stress response
MDGNTPIIVVELIVVFGGTLAFAWWQLRDVRRDQEKAAAERRKAAEATAPGAAEREEG